MYFFKKLHQHFEKSVSLPFLSSQGQKAKKFDLNFADDCKYTYRVFKKKKAVKFHVMSYSPKLIWSKLQPSNYI